MDGRKPPVLVARIGYDSFMNLDGDLCYEAVRSRDARFDGRFFTGVRTTGVYCRPVCPARLPKRENVVFFPCAAAAEDAGFRPCRRCRPETAPGTPPWIVARARRLFDLDTDPLPIATRLARDAALAPLVRARPGLRVPGAWDGFEIAVRAVIGQQVSVAGARTVAGRLAERFGAPVVDGEGEVRFLFPTAERLAAPRALATGMPRSRADTIRRVARAVASGKIDLGAGADPDEVAGRLERIPGVGPWTASCIALRALRDPDAFPSGDLGIRRTLAREGPPITARQAERLAEAWRPWRGYAALHLWTEEAAKEKP